MDRQQSIEVPSEDVENGRESDEFIIENKEKVPLHPFTQVGTVSFPGFYGKHRLQASISNLNNQINILQEELEKLETIGECSTICKDVISSVESNPDPLLPWIQGSVDAGSGWDRWFGGAHNSRNHKRWI
ncbi:guanine nucleotide-binding protein subunit gamma 2-like [Trifolium pratense]|uniref:guanine nucleotide-binding protein subunit gamma 2-like n=1 Tax=Trifolium pratense TaxID=57577 RepID=UPI001E6963BE|nr:guanine nucleotide-binding protein subunit gamma 2-like [Trifolium pratense]